MSYHQIILTTREERPINDDTLHDIIWRIYDQCRNSTAGYPTVRVLDVKGNVVNEATRRNSEHRGVYPSRRTPAIPEAEQPGVQLAGLGYPSEIVSTRGTGVIGFVDNNNLDWAAQLPARYWAFPPYDTLPMASDFDEHGHDCECGECFVPDPNQTVFTPVIRALMTCACSRDGWLINESNVNPDWYVALSHIADRITGAADGSR